MVTGMCPLSSFEFAQIPMAINLGFGITEILASWG